MKTLATLHDSRRLEKQACLHIGRPAAERPTGLDAHLYLFSTTHSGPPS